MQARSQNHWKGLDVSHWQGEIDWKQVAHAGVQFAFIKATEGSRSIDPLWKRNAREARIAGLKVGFYHFARFINESTTIDEATHFINTIHPEVCDLPHVLDLEVTSGLHPTTLSHLAKLFLDKVQEDTSHKVMIYTNTNMAQNHLTSILQNYPLWIAHYGVNRPEDNPIWKNWAVFQYTNKGKMPGINGFVDLNEMVPEANTTVKGQTARLYKIQKGDTFWSLEERNGWKHGTLQKLNPGLDPKRLEIGEAILLP